MNIIFFGMMVHTHYGFVFLVDIWKHYKMVEKKGCGYFSMRFFNLRHHTWEQKATLPSYKDTGGRMDVTLENINIDFERDTIAMSDDCEETPQNLCLAFSMFVLMVLTLPDAVCGLMLPRFNKRDNKRRKVNPISSLDKNRNQRILQNRKSGDPRPHLIEEVLLVQAGGPGLLPRLSMAVDMDDVSYNNLNTEQFAMDTPSEAEEHEEVHENEAYEPAEETSPHRRYSFFIEMD